MVQHQSVERVTVVASAVLLCAAIFVPAVVSATLLAVGKIEECVDEDSGLACEQKIVVSLTVQNQEVRRCHDAGGATADCV
jgi:hypothetical protein